MKIHLMVLIITVITGCGQGEEDSPANETMANTLPIETITDETADDANDDTTENSTQEILTTSDLISEPGFDFISSTDLYLILPIAPSESISYFINICTDFSNENDEVKINYDSCKLRTLLTAQEQLFTLSLSTTESSLIAQIWPVVNDAQPINLYWNIDDSGDSWIIVI